VAEKKSPAGEGGAKFASLNVLRPSVVVHPWRGLTAPVANAVPANQSPVSVAVGTDSMPVFAATTVDLHDVWGWLYAEPLGRERIGGQRAHRA